MLHGMVRVLALALLIGGAGLGACGNGSKSPGDQDRTPVATAGTGEKIAVPGATGEKVAVPGAEGAAQAASGDARGGTSALGAADDPRFHLKPEEGQITISNAETKAGSEAVARLALAPAQGWKVATDYPIKLQLEAPEGVKLEKSELSAGGRNKVQGDAATLTEQALAFDIKATPEKAGSYEIKGVFKFGVCEKDSCHPKKQPVTITVAAN